MAQKILYFTAGAAPTSGEATEIAALESLGEIHYEVKVRNGAADPYYGINLEACDLVAGTVPEAYSEYAAAPEPGAGGSAVVYDGQVIDATGGSITLDVTAGVVTGVFTADP